MHNPMHPIVKKIMIESLQRHEINQPTGNTKGMPPLTALLPSNLAPSLNHNFSTPLTSFQLMIVAPYKRTSMLSPVGRTAVIREFECVKFTWADGVRPGEVAIAVGFFGRSTMFAKCIGTYWLCG